MRLPINSFLQKRHLAFKQDSRNLKHKLQKRGGQFDPESGGHFGPEYPGHFKSESGGQFERNLNISGKDADLSAFGCDFSNFQHIACSVKDHKFMVCLNGKIIFADAVRRSIGKIRGIMIGFEGAGEIKNVKLGDDKHVVYQEDFSKARVVATKQASDNSVIANSSQLPGTD